MSDILDRVAIHRAHTVNDDGIMADCGVMWRRGDEHKIAVTSQELDQWQQWASPVWQDIRQTNVLNVKQARSGNDEKHICPLQLDLIERCIVLWSNAGETVFSPFAGIGSEGVVSIKLGRKFIGTELKESYWRDACGYLRAAEQTNVGLFDAA